MAEREQTPTRKELESAARRLFGSVGQATDDAKGPAKMTGAAVGILGALVAFVWGRRRGRRRKTYVEVRRSK